MSLDVGYLFLVGSSVCLSMVVQQLVVILVLLVLGFCSFVCLAPTRNPAVEVQSPKHWEAREFPVISLIYLFKKIFKNYSHHKGGSYKLHIKIKCLWPMSNQIMIDKLRTQDIE